MDHSQFKANQTAAVYVADGLDGPTQEAFEMHMMACPECVEDVETWRAIKINMPAKVRPLVRPATNIPVRSRQAPAWRLAASVLLAVSVGAAGGWLGHSTTHPGVSDGGTVFFNMPVLTRGAEECQPIKLAPRTTDAVVRLGGITGSSALVALNSDHKELPDGAYSVSVQPDGSRLLQIEVQALAGRAVHLEAQSADGTSEPLGCVTGQQ